MVDTTLPYDFNGFWLHNQVGNATGESLVDSGPRWQSCQDGSIKDRPLPLYFTLPLLFISGTAGGMINVLAGGGSAITLPMLIFLGLSGPTANGTNRVAIFLQNLSAALSFRNEGRLTPKASARLAVFTLPGAIAGAFVAARMDDASFRVVLAVVMVGVVVSMLWPRRPRAVPETSGERQDEKLPLLLYPAMVLIGFYGGFIQMGVGFLIMAALNGLAKFDLVATNAHKVLIVLIYTLPALIVFLISGKVNWTFGSFLALGNAFGGWWAARWAVRKGEGLIRVVLVVAVGGMAAKLLGLF